jgi:hypothetical protein
MVLAVFVTIMLYAMTHASLPTEHRVFFFLGLLALRPPPESDDEAEDEIEDEEEGESRAATV